MDNKYNVKRYIFIAAALFFVAMMIFAAAASAAEKKVADCKSFKELEEIGATAGVITGTTHGPAIEAQFPGIKVNYYNSWADVLTALSNGKIDIAVNDDSSIKYTQASNGGLKIIDDKIERIKYGYIFPKTPKGEALREELNDYLAKIKKDGALEEICGKWIEKVNDARNSFDYDKLPAKNGTITLATNGELPPFSFIKEGKVSGIDLDVIANFCRERGYALKVSNMSFDGLLPAVSSGKCDLGGSGISITKEREESVLFSDPYYSSGTICAANDEGSSSEGSFVSGIMESFDKTFIREDRYKMFLQGVLTTLIITILAIFFGTLLGFGIFMGCRHGNKVAEFLSSIFMWIIQGLPVVVLLMVLYYIVFTKINVGGVFVATFAFTLVFAAAVNGMLRSGVNAVDNGQTEASYALGFSDLETFFRIILPQAAIHFMPSYKTEMISLTKATAVVGYIAVQDLTKMGDLVRSSTYEAFFPLIAVSLIYFALAGAMIFVISKVTDKVDPKHRTKEDILKGVVTDDKA